MNNFLAINLMHLFDTVMTPMFTAISSLISIFVIPLIGHVFMAIALYKMAKNRNILKGRWMAIFPLLNWILLGKIVGEAVVWGKKIKNVGLWIAILSAVTTVLSILLNFAFVREVNGQLVLVGGYLYDFALIFNFDVTITSPFLLSWFMGANVIYTILDVLSLILDIGYIFFEVSIIFLVFRLYRPQSALLYSLFSIFFNPPLFGILLFVVRNNERKSFKQYYHNPYQNYGGYNPYNNPFNNPYNNPNNNPYGNQNGEPKKAPEDPFPEFSDKNGSSSKSDGDDLFS